MSVSKHARHAVSKVISDGEQFLKDHPLFGEDKELPRTAQALKDLAQQVNDGLLTSEEAGLKAEEAVNSELATFPAEKRERLIDQAMSAAIEELLGA
jgi:hypothetical protein